MAMFRAGLAVAAMFIGGIAAFLGVVVTLSALKSGSVQFSYGVGENMVTDIVSRAADEARYWKLVITLGLIPTVLGVLAARWGWRAINPR
jgi:mannose/fructose/N-acetylgalactosamine-specific phosphotransferase system component IID